jgi:hypothetical protein
MEFIHVESTPLWVSDLAERFESNNDNIGALVYMSRLRDGISSTLPVVYIGCGYSGNSSNYPTSIQDTLYSISSSKVRTKVEALDDEFGLLGKISVEVIVSKYCEEFTTIKLFTYGARCVAICDMAKNEIFIPDFTNGISWVDDISPYVDVIASLIRKMLASMNTANLDAMIRDIGDASKSNTHVKYVEVVSETKFDSDAFVKECLTSLKSYETMVDNRYQSVFKRMRMDVISAQERGVQEALSLIGMMKARRFVFISPGALKYTGGKIIANVGIYKDSLYKTNDTLWISGLRLLIEDGKVYEATCYRSFHPNCSGRHVCLGELMGTPIMEAEKIVEALKTPNFSNGYWSDSGSYVGEKIMNIEGDREHIWSD